jgi:hypothetical protein
LTFSRDTFVIFDKDGDGTIDTKVSYGFNRYIFSYIKLNSEQEKSFAGAEHCAKIHGVQPHHRRDKGHGGAGEDMVEQVRTWWSR